MGILKKCFTDPDTGKLTWKTELRSGVNINSAAVDIDHMKGTDKFSGCNSSGTIVEHEAGTTDYQVFIIPSKASNGDIGEYWVENKTDYSFTVKNTGSNNTTEFDWFLITSEIKINNNLDIQEKIKNIEKNNDSISEETQNAKEQIRIAKEQMKNTDKEIENIKKQIEEAEQGLKNIDATKIIISKEEPTKFTKNTLWFKEV